jgi:hypothetical protein
VLADANPDVGGLQIEVAASGSFVELLRATDNRNLLRRNSSAVNTDFALGPVPPGTRFSLGDMLARLPDVLHQYARWHTPPRCIAFSVDKITGTEESNITVPCRWPYIDQNLVVDIVGPNHCQPVSVDAKNVVVKSTRGDTVAAMVTDLIADNFLGIGNLMLAQQYADGVRLSKIGQLFAISYVLGMLVRYHPASWMDLVHQRTGDAALPTIFRVIDCLENLFPQIVVDFLEELRGISRTRPSRAYAGRAPKSPQSGLGHGCCQQGVEPAPQVHADVYVHEGREQFPTMVAL